MRNQETALEEIFELAFKRTFDPAEKGRLERAQRVLLALDIKTARDVGRLKASHRGDYDWYLRRKDSDEILDSNGFGPSTYNTINKLFAPYGVQVPLEDRRDYSRLKRA